MSVVVKKIEKEMLCQEDQPPGMYLTSAYE